MCYHQRIIMKVSILLVLPLFIFASGEKLTYREHESLHSYNKRVQIQLKIRSQHHKLHKVNEEQVKDIVKQETGEEPTSIRVTHKGKYLIFNVVTNTYYLTINALDGSIIEKELKD